MTGKGNASQASGTPGHVEEILLRYDAYEFDAADAIAEMRKVMPRCTEEGARSLLRPRAPRRLP